MSRTNQITTDADVNPVSENIHAIQKVYYRYNFILLNLVHRLTDVLNITSNTFRKPKLLPSSGKMCLISSVSVANTDWE